MASNSHPDVVFVFCLTVFRKTRPSKRDQKQPRHVLHWSHKDLKPTNNGVSAKSFGSYTVTTVSEPCNRFKWARLLKSQSSMSNPALESRGKGAVIMPYSCPAKKKLKTRIKGRLELELYSRKLTSNTSRSILKTILKQV